MMTCGSLSNLLTTAHHIRSLTIMLKQIVTWDHRLSLVNHQRYIPVLFRTALATFYRLFDASGEIFKLFAIEGNLLTLTITF
jgi:hypothetical protein